MLCHHCLKQKKCLSPYLNIFLSKLENKTNDLSRKVKKKQMEEKNRKDNVLQLTLLSSKFYYVAGYRPSSKMVG